jgi:hypothetical protein
MIRLRRRTADNPKPFFKSIGHNRVRLQGELMFYGPESELPILPSTLDNHGEVPPGVGWQSPEECRRELSEVHRLIGPARGFAQLGEQARVLDGDDGLARKILDQLYLLVCEWTRVPAIRVVCGSTMKLSPE